MAKVGLRICICLRSPVIDISGQCGGRVGNAAEGGS